MDEIWKWVEGYEGYYQVSNKGRMKSFHKNKSEGYILSKCNQYGDYLSVQLHKPGTKVHGIRIHVLVAKSFIGEIPAGWHVHHKDGNKQNNNVSNLEIIHPKEHYVETLKEKPQNLSGMLNYNKFERPKHILQYDQEGHFIAEYANGQIASKLTGICQRNILQVATGEEYRPGKVRKQAGGYIWKIKEGEVI
ncbi:MAG: NUMOD4 motif-containing HNH endonuclease [Acetatifactor sp.]|nr:NUMOD4 motif-containing HNH endonuclease [Acetatifactor sp.]